MASEPTDLIREASEALARDDRGVEAEWHHDHMATLVRRLRDALATAQNDIQVIADYAGADDEVTDILRCVRDCPGCWAQSIRRAIDEIRDLREQLEMREGLLLRAGRDNLRLGRIVERVQELADTYGFTPNMTSVHHEIADQITRAIEGPALT